MTNVIGVAPHISVRVPDDWSLDDSVPSTFVAIAAEVEGVLFRPTIVLTSAPTSGPVHVVSSDAIASILADAVVTRAQLATAVRVRRWDGTDWGRGAGC